MIANMEHLYPHCALLHLYQCLDDGEHSTSARCHDQQLASSFPPPPIGLPPSILFPESWAKPYDLRYEQVRKSREIDERKACDNGHWHETSEPEVDEKHTES
jgi:hypothetical protein